MSDEMTVEEATSPYSQHPTLTPESEKYLTRKWMRVCAELTRLRAELAEARRLGQIVLDRAEAAEATLIPPTYHEGHECCRKCLLALGKAEAERDAAFKNGLLEAAGLMRGLYMPLTKEDAELGFAEYSARAIEKVALALLTPKPQEKPKQAKEGRDG